MNKHTCPENDAENVASTAAKDTPEAAADPARETQETETQTALAAAEKTIVELKDKMLRERAELENQRRRLQRDMEQARRFANERLLRDLLDVCDSLERGLGSDTSNAAALREGMELTHKSLLKVVAEHGLEQIDPAGEPFDPEQHEAMSTVPTAEQAPDTVVTVVQKGYKLNQRLLRPALVMVAKQPD